MIEKDVILCRDSLEVMRELPDKSIDLILTDPPYGLKEARGKNHSRGHGKGFTNNTLCRTIKPTIFKEYNWDDSPPGEEYFKEMFRVSKNQIIFGGNFFNLPPSSCWIVWDKDNSGGFADCELAWTSFKSAVRKFRYRWNGLQQENMANKEKRYHPTQKPVAVFKWILEKYSEPGQLIFDPFAGSCTLALACIKTGRRYICVDIVEEYCEIGKKRITGLPNTTIKDFVIGL